MSPSPLMRDVGSSTNTPGCVEQMAATPAPPLSKGMWAGLYPLDGGGLGRSAKEWVWKTRGGPNGEEGYNPMAKGVEPDDEGVEPRGEGPRGEGPKNEEL